MTWLLISCVVVTVSEQYIRASELSVTSLLSIMAHRVSYRVVVFLPTDANRYTVVRTSSRGAYDVLDGLGVVGVLLMGAEVVMWRALGRSCVAVMKSVVSSRYDVVNRRVGVRPIRLVSILSKLLVNRLLSN